MMLFILKKRALYSLHEAQTGTTQVWKDNGNRAEKQIILLRSNNLITFNVILTS